MNQLRIKCVNGTTVITSNSTCGGLIAGSNTSIWSPAVIDSCVESQRTAGNGSGSSASSGGGGGGYVGGGVATTTTNCYPPPHHQNYNPYYSNMDYIGPTAISQLNPVSDGC